MKIYDRPRTIVTRGLKFYKLSPPPANLEQRVADHEHCGCRRVDRSLGLHKMPEGYALMLDSDGLYFYWLTADVESDVHWNKWAVYRGAKKHAQRG